MRVSVKSSLSRSILPLIRNLFVCFGFTPRMYDLRLLRLAMPSQPSNRKL